MYRLVALFVVITSYVEASGNGTKCNGFNANFDLARVIGTWYVVAIIPEAMFPDKQKVPCYEVEFTEIEEVSYEKIIVIMFAKRRSLLNRLSPRRPNEPVLSLTQPQQPRGFNQVFIPPFWRPNKLRLPVCGQYAEKMK